MKANREGQEDSFLDPDKNKYYCSLRGGALMGAGNCLAGQNEIK